MKKSDVETYYDHGTRYPAVNVKHHLWLPDLFRKYEGTGTHEFSDDAGFWAWLHEVYDHDSYDNGIDAADEWARESCWEMAQEAATEIWPPAARLLKWHSRIDSNYTKTERTVWSMGRQGGWCVVDGLPPVEDWDAIDVAKWAKFKRIVDQIAHEEYPYQFVWNLAVNVWEHIRVERENTYPAPNYAGLNA